MTARYTRKFVRHEFQVPSLVGGQCYRRRNPEHAELLLENVITGDEMMGLCSGFPRNRRIEPAAQL